MKLSDFRIGNLVNEDHFVKAITLENELTIWNKSGYDFLNIIDIEPIPLTVEWVEKFGFSLTDYETDEDVIIEVYYKEINDNCMYFINLCDDGFNEFGFVTSFADVMLNNNLKYVHQLQNLYFALTGEELTLKD